MCGAYWSILLSECQNDNLKSMHFAISTHLTDYFANLTMIFWHFSVITGPQTGHKYSKDLSECFEHKLFTFPFGGACILTIFLL